ncbi:unnamed protein product [Brassica oleracea]
MDSRGDSSRFGLQQYPTKSSRNMSSSSSAAFFSANQSPFFSARSLKPQDHSESTRSDPQCDSFDPLTSSSDLVFQNLEPSSSVIPRFPRGGHDSSSYAQTSSVSVSYNRVRCCDVFLGLHGNKPSLLRFADWLRFGEDE